MADNVQRKKFFFNDFIIIIFHPIFYKSSIESFIYYMNFEKSILSYSINKYNIFEHKIFFLIGNTKIITISKDNILENNFSLLCLNNYRKGIYNYAKNIEKYLNILYLKFLI